MVERIQRDLFALGSRLADPSHRIADRVTKASVTVEDTARLEQWIDELEAGLPPLRRFILAGGSPGGAAFHVARTVCRRAERAIVSLGENAVDDEILVYVNRLSDLLFVLARAANARGARPARVVSQLDQAYALHRHRERSLRELPCRFVAAARPHAPAHCGDIRLCTYRGRLR